MGGERIPILKLKDYIINGCALNSRLIKVKYSYSAGVAVSIRIGFERKLVHSNAQIG